MQRIFNFCRAVLELLTEANNPHAFQIGEIFILEGLANQNSSFILSTLQYWAVNKANTKQSSRHLLAEPPSHDQSVYLVTISGFFPKRKHPRKAKSFSLIFFCAWLFLLFCP